MPARKTSRFVSVHELEVTKDIRRNGSCTDDELLDFLTAIDKPLLTDECVLSTTASRGSTKGNLHTQKWFRGRLWLTHRLAYHLFVAPIPISMHVLHKCPSDSDGKCINPRHLAIGTHADNMRDRTAAGHDTVFQGEDHPSSKLDNEAVQTIRRELAKGARQSRLAAEFNVSYRTISAIKKGKIWRHLPPPE